MFKIFERYDIGHLTLTQGKYLWFMVFLTFSEISVSLCLCLSRSLTHSLSHAHSVRLISPWKFFLECSVDGSLPLRLQVMGVGSSHCEHISALDLYDVKNYCCMT